MGTLCVPSETEEEILVCHEECRCVESRSTRKLGSYGEKLKRRGLGRRAVSKSSSRDKIGILETARFHWTSPAAEKDKLSCTDSISSTVGCHYLLAVTWPEFLLHSLLFGI